MKITKRQLRRIIKEARDKDNMFGDNRKEQWRLIDQLVGTTLRSDLERAEALRELADELEDRHHDEGAVLGF